MSDWGVIWLTVRTAALSAALILPFGIAAAWLLARKRWYGKSVV